MNSALWRGALISVAFVLISGGSASASEDPFLSMDVMRKATLGSYKGAFINCGANEGIEIQLREAKGDGQSLSLEGTLKTNDLSAGGTGPQIEAEIRGIQLADTGYVSLSPKPRRAPANEAPSANALGFFKERLGIKDAPKAAPVSFEAGFIRDFEGVGFVGVVSSSQFRCHAFTVSRSDGSRSNGVPLPNVEFILRQAGLQSKFIYEDPPFDGSATGALASRYPQSSTFDDAPWLLYAAKLGHPKALAYLGRMYEFGLGVPLNYEQALSYYKQAAEHNNAMAQLGLARLYVRGFGVERDTARSKQFGAQYGATRLAALKLCTDSTLLSTVTGMITAGMNEPPQATTIGSILGGVMASSRKIDAGSTFVYQKVAAVDLATVDAPFLCKFTVKLVDAKVTDMTPYREWAIRDSEGRVSYYNNQTDIDNGRAMADLTTLLANNMSVLEVFEVQALGGNRYRVSRMQGGMTGALESVAVAEVEVNRRP